MRMSIRFFLQNVFFCAMHMHVLRVVEHIRTEEEKKMISYFSKNKNTMQFVHATTIFFSICD